MLLLSSHKLTKAKTLNPIQGYVLNSKSHKERERERERELGSVSLALAYEKQQGKHLSNPRIRNTNKWSSWGTYTPHKED
jgi:hypothetical protein